MNERIDDEDLTGLRRQDWTVTAPDEIHWTPAELAQIGEAVRQFQAALPGVHPFVILDGVRMLPTWAEAPTYGPAEFAAALLDQYQPAGPHGCRGQRLLWASPPHGPSCLLAAGHEGDCEFPETWVDPVTGKTIAVASHGRGDQA